MTTSTSEQHTTSGSEHYQGRVKWFNNKAGYGFITVTGSPVDGDVFVHHSSLSVSEEQYKYLVQGEYVEFELARVDGGQHEWQASNVRGCNGGKLMCETRREVRSARTSHSTRSDEDYEQRTGSSGRPSYAAASRRSEDARSETRPVRRTRQPTNDTRPRHSQDERHAPVRYAGQGPRGDGVEWMLVRRTPPRSSHQQQSRPRQQRPRPHQQPSEQEQD